MYMYHIRLQKNFNAVIFFKLPPVHVYAFYNAKCAFGYKQVTVFGRKYSFFK